MKYKIKSASAMIAMGWNHMTINITTPNKYATDVIQDSGIMDVRVG